MQESISKSQLEEVLTVLSQCTDAYIFAYELESDTCLISKRALDLFDFPAERFGNASFVFDKICYSEDRALLKESRDQILTGKQINHNVEYRWTTKDGRPAWINCRGKVSRLSNEKSVLIGRVILLKEEDKIDLLTRLPLESQLRTEFAQEYALNQKVSGFMMKIDVDNLGLINEQYGTDTGDKVLQIVADACRKSSAGMVHTYKLNSDEFLCVNLTGLKAADAQKFYIALKRNLADAEQEISYDVMFTVSLGLVAFFSDSTQFDELLKRANFSMQEAKRKGRNNLTTFNSGAYNQHLRDIDLQEKMRESVRNNDYARFKRYTDGIDGESGVTLRSQLEFREGRAPSRPYSTITAQVPAGFLHDASP